MPDPAADVAGVVLAGGLGRRMGDGDKCLRPLGGQPLIAHVIARARPQVATLLLNVNDSASAAELSRFGLPIAPDVVTGFAGPLAGILTAMRWAQASAPSCRWLASFAADTPFLPLDLVERLRAAVADDSARDGAAIACAASGGRSHPVIALWPVALADDLEAAVTVENIRKIDAWTARYAVRHVSFAIEAGDDPFFNVNTPQDLTRAAERLTAADRSNACRQKR
ncbi:Molybdenum cofactor guanylyltransferase [Candidatus Defluviicoccus seviourii]|uniref:Molybdenum cofactor guanylyltransferase n=1 Tax=Candidatus Defluviicoccus seviourii TaxID=2565273 RepID=A0A564WJ11_9PROT|nr:Molybdenum cofactor guanylyltransferase [Candidatus Defluviicoccus seviourii]